MKLEVLAKAPVASKLNVNESGIPGPA